MSFNTYIGWDIGGAHLKMASIAHSGAVNDAQQLATPLWNGLDSLEHAISTIHNQITEDTVTHTITMTAELADIFEDRKTGVKEISGLINRHFGKASFRFYAGRSGLINADKVNTHIADIASANWHATASFLAQHVDEGVLIDIGSTTTDIIPFVSGQLLNSSYSDHERLRNNELVYSGIIRTPVMAVVKKMLCHGQWQNIAAENFSTMADVYRLTNELNEQYDMMMTADGAGKSLSDSARRLLRMVGLDHQDEHDIQAVIDMAKQVADAHLEILDESLLQVLTKHRKDTLIGAGAGRFLVRKLASKNKLKYIDFTDFLSYPKSQEHQVLSCATAVSVAQLTRAIA